MTYTLGVDVGTYETKGALVDGEGRVVAQAARGHEMLTPRPGWAEHLPEEAWWGDVVHVTRALLAESGVAPEAVAALAVSAIGPCMLPVDAENRPLMNGVLYGVDNRASKEVAELTERLGADRILDRCGNALTSQSVGPKVLWLARNRPEIWAKTARVHTATSFIVERLTGEAVIDHYTAASFSPLYDVTALDWADDLSEGIVGRAMLPRPMWSGAVAGRVTQAAAEATGLAEGTPVTTGTIDAAAEAVSVGTRRVGDMMMMYGSTVFIIGLTERRVRDPRLWYAPWLFAGGHACMAGLATSGTLTHWFRDRFARELPREDAFGRLAAEAAEAPEGANSLLFLPYFSGERTPIHDPHAKGAWFGLNLTHSRGDLYRALLEGIAFGAAHVAEAYREAGAAPAQVLAVGGGVRNRLWLQATSDACGLRQIVREKTVGAAYGDALLARIALGEATPQTVDEWNPAIETVEPREVAAYARLYPLWRSLYTRTKDLMAALDG